MKRFERKIAPFKENIKTVCMDMASSYTSWAADFLPNATIVIDRFHVIKALNDRLDKARRKVMAMVDEKTAKQIKGNRRLGVGFDSMFNMGDTNRLYCTEMVRLAVNEAVGTNLVGFTKVCGCNVVAIDDLYRNGFRRIYDSCHPELCTNEVGNIKGLLQKEEIAE